MATAVFKYAKCLDSTVQPELLTATSGAAITAGAPLVWSSGKLVEAVGGIDTHGVVGVAAHAVSAADMAIKYYPALPNVAFRTSSASAALTTGALYGLVATTLLIDAANTTQTRLRVIEPVNAESEYLVVFNGWLTV